MSHQSDTGNDVGLSLVSEVTIVSRRSHQTPRGPKRLTVCRLFEDALAVAASRDAGKAEQCFRTLRSLAPPRGRNVTPPALSLPGPFDTAHCWTTLAGSYPSAGRLEATSVEDGSSREFWTGTDPPR